MNVNPMNPVNPVHPLDSLDSFRVRLSLPRSDGRCAKEISN